MSLPLMSLIAGLALWVLIAIWAERHFRRITKGRKFKRKLVYYNWEKVETDDPFVKRAHLRRRLTIYLSFAVIAIVLLVVFPNA
jgi:hypothetical protein